MICICSSEERNKVDTKLLAIWREKLGQYEELSKEIVSSLEKKGIDM